MDISELSSGYTRTDLKNIDFGNVFALEDPNNLNQYNYFIKAYEGNIDNDLLRKPIPCVNLKTGEIIRLSPVSNEYESNNNGVILCDIAQLNVLKMTGVRKGK